MLTNDDKEKIKLEELYRIEICQQLKEKSHPRSRVWLFLNSTFGLWLLSAILVTWAGMLYTQSQNRRSEALRKQETERAEELKQRELVERLDLEIGYRFSQFQIHLTSLVNRWGPSNHPFPFQPGKGEKDVKDIIDSLSRPASNMCPPLYEEFESLSTLALIAELRRHVQPQERNELDKVIADLSGVYIFLDVSKVKLSDVYGVGSAVFDGLTLQRWRQGRFYFSDCPFC
jgi:hypothetical protein